jgi:hypothetical protein
MFVLRCYYDATSRHYSQTGHVLHGFEALCCHGHRSHRDLRHLDFWLMTCCHGRSYLIVADFFIIIFFFPLAHWSDDRLYCMIALMSTSMWKTCFFAILLLFNDPSFLPRFCSVSTNSWKIKLLSTFYDHSFRSRANPNERCISSIVMKESPHRIRILKLSYSCVIV